MSKRLEFFLVFLDNGKKGFYIIHNNELYPRPNLKKEDLQDYNLLYTVGNQVYQYIKEKAGAHKIWTKATASPKEFIKHTNTYTPVYFFEDKNMNVQVYVSTKQNLANIYESMSRFSQRKWYKTLCKRLGVAMMLSSLLLSGCGLKEAPQEPLSLAPMEEEQMNLSEYIIMNYTHDVPYIVPVDNLKDDYIAYYYDDSFTFKLIYANKSKGITSIEVLYDEEGRVKLKEIQKEEYHETST